MRNFGEIQISEPPAENIAKTPSTPREESASSHLKNKNTPEQPKLFNRRQFLMGAALTAFALSLPSETIKSKSLIAKLSDYLQSFSAKKESANLNTEDEDELTVEKLKEKIKEESEPSVEMQSLAREVQIRSHQLLRNEKFFPKELFDENFFIAVQIQESNLEKDAESEAGAIGIMQVRPITVREVVRYLNILKKDKKINFDGPKMKNLSEENIIDLLILIKRDADLGKAFGKLYFAELLNNFKIGKKDFNAGDIPQSRRKILAAYNWNPNNLKRNENNESAWPRESRDYCANILTNISSLKMIQKEMAGLKMKTESYELSTLLTIELNRYENIDIQDPFFVKMIHAYLKNIHTIETIKERPLNSRELHTMIEVSNPASFRLYANYNKKMP